MSETKELVFSSSPTVAFASSLFVGMPVIPQADNTPLIEMVRGEDAGFPTQMAGWLLD